MNRISKLIKSFGYAFRGIFSTIKNERNMRIHLSLLTYMLSFLIFGNWFVLSKTQWCIILICSSLVISGELINTAIENTVDLCTSQYSAFAEMAKDAASGAVLVSAIFAVAAGIIILLQPEAFKAMFHYFAQTPVAVAALVLSFIPTLWFIFFFGENGKKEKNEKDK